MEKFNPEKYCQNSIEDFSQPEGGRGLDMYKKHFSFQNEELEGKDILDLGAGPETKFDKELKQSGIKAHVISLSPDFSDERYRRKALTSNPEANLVAAVGQEMPFKNESFDNVFALHVMQHVFSSEAPLTNSIKIIEEIARVLKIGGKGYLSPLIQQEYMAIINDKDLMRILKKNEVRISMEFLPSGLMAKRRVYDSAGLPDGMVDAIRIVLEKEKMGGRINKGEKEDVL